MKIAMLTYSVKPRGGVEHALAVAEALAGRGHEVCVSALAQPGEAFFRATPVQTRLVEHVPTAAAFDERILAMVAAYREGLRPLLADGGFDIVHAQDCISANAALDLRDEGVIEHVVRTVHHVDDFISPSLIACQDRSILAPDLVLCVSQPWIERLADEFGVEARLVRNGVDCDRFRAPRDAAERAADRDALGLGDRLTVLTVGGIEPRKGSLTLLEGFARLRAQAPELDPLLLDRRRRDAVRLPRRDRPLRRPRARARRRRARAQRRHGHARRARAPLPRRRRLRVPVDEGGLRPRRARGARRGPAGRRIGDRRLPDVPASRPERAAVPARRRRRARRLPHAPGVGPGAARAARRGWPRGRRRVRLGHRGRRPRGRLPRVSGRPDRSARDGRLAPRRGAPDRPAVGRRDRARARADRRRAASRPAAGTRA